MIERDAQGRAGTFVCHACKSLQEVHPGVERECFYCLGDRVVFRNKSKIKAFRRSGYWRDPTRKPPRATLPPPAPVCLVERDEPRIAVTCRECRMMQSVDREVARRGPKKCPKCKSPLEHHGQRGYLLMCVRVKDGEGFQQGSGPFNGPIFRNVRRA